MKQSLTLIAGVAITAFSLQTTQADQIVFVPASGDWNVVGNWYNNTLALPAAALPGVADQAIMNQSKIANVNSAVGTTAGNIISGNQLPGVGTGTTLNVNPGGSLNYQGTAFIGPSGSSSLLQVQGGSLTSVNTGANRTVLSGYATDPSVSVFGISSGIFTAQGSNAPQAIFITAVTLDISGGTIDMTGGQVIPVNHPVFNVSGDAATINIDRLNMNTSGRVADWNFTLGATGVSPVQSAAWVNLGYANISVDGSAYAGPGGIIDLFTAVNVASTVINPVNITGFGSQYNVVYEQSTLAEGGNYSRLNITLIPEPTTFALLGLGSLALVITRQRR